MSTRQTFGDNRGWRARVKIRGVEHYLGTFPTKAQADAAEDLFRDGPQDDWWVDLELAAKATG